MENKLTPESFLESEGINLNACQFLAYIEGYMRSPNICWLMEEYHKRKLNELDIKLGNFNDTKHILY